MARPGRAHGRADLAEDEHQVAGCCSDRREVPDPVHPVDLAARRVADRLGEQAHAPIARYPLASSAIEAAPT